MSPPAACDEAHFAVPWADCFSHCRTKLFQEALGLAVTVQHADVRNATAKGDNYLSVIYRARVQYSTAESDEVHTQSLIAKVLPPGELIQRYIQETDIFEREIAVYKDLLPRLYAFVDSKLGRESFKISANYYPTSRSDTLILEDLCQQGFALANRRNRLDLAHSKLVVKYLARLHAVSFAYTEENPRYISQFDDKILVESNRDRLEKFIGPQFSKFTEVIRQWKGFEQTAKKLDSIRDVFVSRLIDITKPKESVRKVFLHGDCWVNNIMFKYSETKEPVDLRFVDFQVSHEGSAVQDLHYFLSTSLRNEVRVHHLRDLLQDYCVEFGHWVKQLGYNGPPLDIEEISLEFDRTACLGFAAAMCTVPAVLAEPSDTPDMKSLTEEKMESGNVQFFDKVYGLAVLRDTFEILLPYFEERGVFDV